MKSEGEFLEELYNKNIKELREFGRSVGVVSPATLSKGDLIASIRAIVYGLEMPKIKKSTQNKPLRDEFKNAFEQKRQEFFNNILDDELPTGNDESLNLSFGVAASPTETLKNRENLFSDGTKDDFAIVCVTDKEQFVYDNKTKQKLAVSKQFVKDNKLHDGDLVFGNVLGQNGDVFNLDILWINGYWIKKPNQKESIKEPFFDFAQDNYGYSRMVGVFAPIERGKSNLVATMTAEMENQILSELCADVLEKEKNVCLQGIGLGLLKTNEKTFKSMLKENSALFAGKFDEDKVAELETILAKNVERFNAGTEVLVVFRNLQVLYREIAKQFEDEQYALESIKTILGYANKNENALTILASIIFDDKDAYDLYANLSDEFASEFHTVPDENEKLDYELCDIEKCRCNEELLQTKHKKFIEEQKNLAKIQGLFETNKQIYEKINNTKANAQFF